MIEFKVARHHFRGATPVVEVFHDGQFVATIIPVDGERAVRLVSKHALAISPVEQREPTGINVVQVDIKGAT